MVNRVKPSALSAAFAAVLSSVLLAQQLPRYTERVDVTRVLIDVRALDGRGEPILGLGPDDFRVRIDGKPARVESVQWIADGAVDREGAPIPATERTGYAVPAAPGRLVVFLFQKDLEPSRIVGFMRLLIETRQFLESFRPADRVAVVSFDYHLKVWIDVTNESAQNERILERGILFERPRPV